MDEVFLQLSTGLPRFYSQRRVPDGAKPPTPRFLANRVYIIIAIGQGLLHAGPPPRGGGCGVQDGGGGALGGIYGGQGGTGGASVCHARCAPDPGVLRA